MSDEVSENFIGINVRHLKPLENIFWLQDRVSIDEVTGLCKRLLCDFDAQQDLFMQSITFLSENKIGFMMVR